MYNEVESHSRNLVRADTGEQVQGITAPGVILTGKLKISHSIRRKEKLLGVEACCSQSALL